MGLVVRPFGDQPREAEPTNARDDLRVIGFLRDHGQANTARDGFRLRREGRHAVELGRKIRTISAMAPKAS
jgi:hypothetical protein